jgi:hypothetical protein
MLKLNYNSKVTTSRNVGKKRLGERLQAREPGPIRTSTVQAKKVTEAISINIGLELIFLLSFLKTSQIES